MPQFPPIKLFQLIAGVACCAFLIACEKAERPEASHKLGFGAVQVAAISENADFALLGSLHYGASLWQVSERKRIFDWRHDPKEAPVLSAADFAPDQPLVASAEQDTLVLWDTEHGDAERFWSAPAKILSAQLGAGGHQALLGLANHSAVLFNVQRGGVIHNFKHSAPVTSVAIDTSSGVALSAAEDGQVSAWQLDSGKALTQVRHQDAVQVATLSHNGQLAFSASQYDRALLWKTNNGEIISQISLQGGRFKRGTRLTAARFGPDDELLLIGQSDRTVVLWDVKNWQELVRWQLPGARRWPPSSAVVLDVGFADQAGVFYAISSDGQLHRLKRPDR